MVSDLDCLEAHGISFAFGDSTVVREVNLRVNRAETVALAGPNGSGKTTILRLLSGDLHPSRGAITIGGEPLTSMPPSERARRIAVVPQHVEPGLSFTVRTLVGMGRAPHLRFFGTLSPRDVDVVADAMIATDTAQLANRRFHELSGGEQQRVVVAMALAQETPYLLLDEPTVHLDLEHQSETLELLRRLQAERRIGLLTVMHDLNLAALYFDRIVLLRDGQLVADGAPAEILTTDDLLAVFRAPLSVVTHPDAAVPQILLRRQRESRP